MKLSTKTKWFLWFWAYLMITAGCFLVAVAMELLLSPNGLIDGGVSGLSIMGQAKFGISMNVMMFAINIPILFFTARTLGKKFFFRSFYANVMTLLFLSFLKPFSALSFSDLLTTIYSGLMLGLGVGLVVRYGGAIDGTEMLAVWFNKKKGISISNFLLGINVVIILISIFVFSLQSAMFSFIIFYNVSKVIDRVESGLNESKSVFIISDHSEVIGERLMKELKMSVTFLYGEGGYSGKKTKIIYCIANRFVYNTLKDIVFDVDTGAILEASNSSETHGLKRQSPYARLVSQSSILD